MKKNVIVILIIVSLIVVAGVAFALGMTVLKGNGYFYTAKPIYDTTVEKADSDNKLYSYYNVKIKNYNDNNEISMVDFDYEVKVESTDGSELPQYYWCDQNGNIIGSNLKGSLKNTTKDENVYTICFLNSGETTKTSNINISTTAVQKNDDEWIDAKATAISGLSTDKVSSVTLEIVGPTENNIDVATNGYSFDGGATWQSSNSKTYTENTQKIVIKVKDKSGKIYIHPQFDINNIN